MKNIFKNILKQNNEWISMEYSFKKSPLKNVPRCTDGGRLFQAAAVVAYEKPHWRT